MATWRVIWEFTENNGGTFSEVYYQDGAAVANVLPVPPALVTARLAMLHPLNTLLRVRISNTAALRQTGTQPVNLAGTVVTDSGPVAVGDAAVFALASNSGGTRKLWLRGCPDSFLSRSPDTGQDKPPAAFVKVYTAWIAALADALYGIRKITPQAPGPLQNVPIVSVDGTAKNGQSLVTLSKAPGYAVPSQVVIGGASKKDLPGFNGVFSVLAVNNMVVTIPYQTPGGLLIQTTTAHMRQAVYLPTAVFTPALCAFDHYGTHTSKNPLSRSRGSRRAARLRLSL